MINRYLVSGFLVIWMSLHGEAWAQSGPLIRMGIEALVPPFESRDAKGELVGLNIEIGNAICADLGARCVWVDQPYVDHIPGLKANKIDVIMPMTPTETRRKEIDFTEVMYPLASKLVGRKGSSLLPSVKSLAGQRVGVLTGTSRENFALTRWAPAGVQVRSYLLNAELVEDLKTGKIDATLQDTIEIREALLKTSAGADYELLGDPVVDPLLGAGVAMGLRKTDGLLKEQLNRALAKLKSNGEMDKIVAKYLPVTTAAPAQVAAQSHPLRYDASTPGVAFSDAVRAGNVLYLAGVLGEDANGRLLVGTAGQTRAAMTTIRDVVQRNGSSLDRLIQCRVILRHIEDFDEMNRVYKSFFPNGRFPARTTFAASGLVADAGVEIECIAHVD